MYKDSPTRINRTAANDRLSGGAPGLPEWPLQLESHHHLIERYRCRESSVEEALVEMYLASVSVHRVEDITEALWGSKVSPSILRRNWGEEYENVAILVAIAVNGDGYLEVLSAAEGMKADKDSWVNFL